MGERFAIVMAGGSGTRFWPASRATRPKQFLRLAGTRETLLQATVRRASEIVSLARVIVVVGERHAALAIEQLPDLPRENLLLEPTGRNTAPCIAWAAAHVRRRDAQGVIAALPADPHIADEGLFAEALARALDAANTGAIVTLGVEPTRPETGYGYLEVGAALEPHLHRVGAFVEKPTRERAQHFVQSGRYLWNSGMFFFRADVILREIDRHLPELGKFVTRLDRAPDSGAERALINAEYAALPSISIDYGVMERAGDIVVVPARFGWDDLGSWAAAWTLAHKDDQGNSGNADLLAIDSSGCLARAPSGKLVVLLGLSDTVVVDTEDALLVMPRERAQDVSKVVQALKALGRDGQL